MRRSKSFEPLTPRAAHGFLTSIYLSQSCLVCLFVCLFVCFFLLTSPKRRDCLALSRIICMEKTVAFRIQTISSFELWKRKKTDLSSVKRFYVSGVVLRRLQKVFA